jgi:hypothetical protein
MNCGGWSRRWAIGLLACGLLGGACGSGSDSPGSGQPIASTTLAGTIGGQPWSFVSGETDAFLSSGSTDFFTTLYMESVDVCTGAGFSVTSNQIIAEIPMAIGDYTKSVTFVVGPGTTNDNLITSGHVVVNQVTATSVSGGLYARFDANNIVNGQFTATVCAQ